MQVGSLLLGQPGDNQVRWDRLLEQGDILVLVVQEGILVRVVQLQLGMLVDQGTQVELLVGKPMLEVGMLMRMEDMPLERDMLVAEPGKLKQLEEQLFQ